MQTRWKQRPPGSTWGDFGPDDQIGRLNLLTPEKVKQGVAEVREGLVFCLSLPLDYPGGNKLNARRHAPRLAPTYREDVPYLNFPLRNVDPQASDVISDDQATSGCSTRRSGTRSRTSDHGSTRTPTAWTNASITTGTARTSTWSDR